MGEKVVIKGAVHDVFATSRILMKIRIPKEWKLSFDIC